MSVRKQWNVDVSIEERPETRRTEAQATLDSDHQHLIGSGVAQRFPRDPDRPGIGDELAVARALADLARQLTSTAMADIDAAGNSRWSEV